MEKYGTIPPRFTKAWWSYIWDYYKWHIIASIAAILMISITAVQCATQTHYDITVTYAGSAGCTDEAQGKISEFFQNTVGDVNGNGKNEVLFQALKISSAENQVQDAQYEMAMQTKLMLELQAGESFLFLLSPERAEILFSGDGADGFLVPVSEWYPGQLSEERQVSGSLNGYAVRLENPTVFTEAGFDCGEVYLAVRQLRSDETKEKNIENAEKQQQASKKAAAAFVDRQK